MTEAEQRQYIRDNYLTIPVNQLAREVGRSETFVYGQLKRESLVIPKRIIEQRKKDSRYKKAQEPANKNIPQIKWMSREGIERSKRTRFKQGRSPHNTKEKYKLSIRNSKGYDYIWIKISNSNWELYHRWVWMKLYGPIPSGCNVQFKDGNSLNCAPENLYLISRNEQVQINHLYQGKYLPYELQETALLITQLTKTINEK